MASLAQDPRRSASRRTRARLAGAVCLAAVQALSACAGAGAAELPPSPHARFSTDPARSAPVWRWRRIALSASGQGQGIAAVAVEPRRGGRIAVGDGAGVALQAPGERFRFAARVADVSDLAFDAQGGLWVASLSGLWRLERDGRLLDRSPAPGEAARTVHRVHVSGDWVVAATEAGAWASLDGRAWVRLADGLPGGPVTAIARDGSLEVAGATGDFGLFLLAGRELWRVRLGRGAGRPELREARRLTLSNAPSGEAPVDLASSAAGAEVVVLYPRLLAVRAPGDAARIWRPVLPPGAVARRLGRGAGRVWLATDQGLLHARGWEGPWRRSESPAGRASVLGLAATAEGDGLLAASPSGLLRGAPVLLAGEPMAPGGEPRAHRSHVPDPGRDPDIRSVHAASLRYLDLGPERMRQLAAGLAVRGWLPSVSLRLAGARDSSWGRDDDQSFVSGETRFLRDRDQGRSLDLEASLVMSWQLGDLAFDGDAIDVSREHRLVVSLRDNVLDEVNQLYFERRGLLEQLRGDPPPAPDERLRMQLRAAELAAGLDAWTGGWFSSRARGSDLASTTHPSQGPGPEVSR